MLRRLGRQTLRKQNYRHLSCEYMGQVSSHVPSCAPLSLLAARPQGRLTPFEAQRVYAAQEPGP